MGRHLRRSVLHTIDGEHQGISAAVLTSWLGRVAKPADMRGIQPNTVQRIYSTRYAFPLRLEEYPSSCGLLFDVAVQHGVAGTIEIAQQVVSVAVDGALGPVTAAAISAYGVDFPADMTTAFMGVLQSLTEEWRLFGHGWQARSDRRLAFAQHLQAATVSA